MAQQVLCHSKCGEAIAQGGLQCCFALWPSYMNHISTLANKSSCVRGLSFLSHTSVVNRNQVRIVLAAQSKAQIEMDAGKCHIATALFQSGKPLPPIHMHFRCVGTSRGKQTSAQVFVLLAKQHWMILGALVLNCAQSLMHIY